MSRPEPLAAAENVLPHANLLRIVARELGQVVGSEPLSDRARRMLIMAEGVLRHVIVAQESDQVPAARSVAEELAAMAAWSQAERQVSLFERSADATARLDVTTEKLTKYFRRNGLLEGDARIGTITKLLGGFSKETFLVDFDDASRAGAVIRRDVEFGPVDTSVVDEFPVLAALFARGLEVPEPLLIESDPAVLGAPFLVSARAEGTAPSNTDGIAMGPEQRAGAAALANFLARQHALDLPSLALPGRWSAPDLDMHDHLRWEIDEIERTWREHGRTESAIVTDALAWLKEHMPDVSGERAALVHGDAGLHNRMMHVGRISGMLDWELAQPGDPTEDLSYCRTWVDQVIDWDEFLALYYAAGGRPYHAERERFYGVLADLRVVMFAVRSVAQAHTSDHPELPVAFAAVHYSRVFRSKVGQRLLDAAIATAP